MVKKFIKETLGIKTTLTTYGVGLLQAKVYRILKSFTAKVLKKYRISTIEWAMLGLLYENSAGMRYVAIAKEIGVEAPFVSHLVDTLTKKDLIEIQADELDKRAKKVLLNAKGNELVGEVEKVLRQEIKKLLKGASPQGVIGYLKTMEKIVQNGEADDEGQI